MAAPSSFAFGLSFGATAAGAAAAAACGAHHPQAQQQQQQAQGARPRSAAASTFLCARHGSSAASSAAAAAAAASARGSPAFSSAVLCRGVSARSASARMLRQLHNPLHSAKFMSTMEAELQRRRGGGGGGGIVAIDPDFYKIPHEVGIPQGARLKLYNLPPAEDREKLKRDLIEWFVTCEPQDEPVTVVSFEYAEDPAWIEQGVGAFVEFGSKWQAVTVYARLDASKFQGRYVRMNFVERAPYPPEWLAKNAKWFRDDSKRSSAKIFVGNLAWSVDDAKLQRLFAAHGTVYDAKVMTDRETGRSRGFGFVTMSTEDEMNKAIEALDGAQLDGRPLRVNQAAAKA